VDGVPIARSWWPRTARFYEVEIPVSAVPVGRDAAVGAFAYPDAVLSVKKSAF